MSIFSFVFHKFQVTLEECPSVTFADTSAEKCWELVVQRLNQEILQQNSLGVQGELPAFHMQSVNGLEMFGFLSPNIIQVRQSKRNFKQFSFSCGKT